MSFNTTSLLYYYNRTFSSANNYTWNVSCNGSALGYEPLNLSDTVTIIIDTTPPEMYLEYPENDTRDTDGYAIFKYNITDVDLTISNCSLIINNRVNHTNYTIEENISQNFTLTLNDGEYNWSINCSDTASNINSSETRTIEMDYVENWATPNCNYRINLTFNNTQIESLIDFSVMLKLDSSRIDYSKTTASDIRFYDSNNLDILKHHWELWNETGDSFGWVKIPQIDATSTTDHIFAYYNCSDTATQNNTGTYDSNYVGVWHLNETTGNAVDSTSYGNDGTVTATQGVNGKIDGAYWFSRASGQQVALSNLAVSTTAGDKTTVVFWMYWEGVNGIMPFGWTTYDLYFSGGHFGFNTGNSDIWGMSSSSLSNTWKHVVAVFYNGDGRESELYIDGVNQTLTQRLSTTQSRNVVATAKISGWNNGATYKFGGTLDEVTISNISRSSSWANATYLTMNDDFMIYSSEESIDENPPVITLNYPENNSFSSNLTNLFNFTPNDSYNITNCTLVINGTLNQTNQSAIIKNTQNSITTNISEGNWLWTVNCTDKYENIGTNTNQRILIIDTTNPITNITHINPNPSNHSLNNITINWTASDSYLDANYANVSYPNGSLLGIYYTNFTLTTNNLSTPGNYTLTVFANDSVGNINTTTNILVVNDATAPNTVLVAPFNNGFSNSTIVTFYYNVSDISTVANCSLILYGSTYVTNSTINKSKTNSITYDLGADGDYPWSINCTDNGSYHNTGNSSTWTITVDTTPPTINLNSPADNSWDSSGLIQLNYTPEDGWPDDNLDTCELWGNFSGIWGKNQTEENPINDDVNNFSFINLNDGTYIWNVYCNDSSSNFNWDNNWTINVDMTYPIVNFTEPTPENNSNQTSRDLTINVTNLEYNPHTIILYWNNTQNETKSYNGAYTNFTLTGLTDGIYTYYIWLNDSVGNYNSTENRTIRIDNVPPVVYLENPGNNTWKNNNTNPILFEYNVSDAMLTIANCSLIINDKINHTNHTIEERKTQNFTQIIGSGYYNWSVNCSDVLENKNSSEEKLLKVDLSFPSINNEAINATNFTVNEYVCLNVTVSDTYSDVNSVKVQVNYPVSGLQNVSLSNATSSCGGAGGNIWSYLLYNNEEGNYNWTMTFAQDIAGNINFTVPPTQLNWNATIDNEINVSLIYPTTNIEINESGSNNDYVHNCSVECMLGSCNDVYAYPQYNNDTWNYITTDTTQLISSTNNHSCGNLNTSTWWNSSWDKRKEIDITNVGTTELLNFPAYLNISYDTDMFVNFTDLRFINGSCSSGTIILDYEIENYTVSKADIWIRIPTLSTGINKICMYYDNPEAEAGENASGVWDDNYSGIYHLSESGTSTPIKEYL